MSFTPAEAISIALLGALAGFVLATAPAVYVVARVLLSRSPTGGGRGSYRSVGAGRVPEKPPDATGGGVGPALPAAPCRGAVLDEAELELIHRQRVLGRLEQASWALRRLGRPGGRWAGPH